MANKWTRLDFDKPFYVVFDPDDLPCKFSSLGDPGLGSGAFHSSAIEARRAANKWLGQIWKKSQDEGYTIREVRITVNGDDSETSAKEYRRGTGGLGMSDAGPGERSDL
jgi:hypothetical protein